MTASMSSPWPTSATMAMTSKERFSLSHGMMMEVSRPPEYARTTFSALLDVNLDMGAPDGHTAHAAAQQLIEDGFLDVHAVFGLVEDDARLRIDNSIRHFLAAVRGQTVHEERVRRGFCHECFVDLVGRK